jgi:hypothetical protein
VPGCEKVTVNEPFATVDDPWKAPFALVTSCGVFPDQLQVTELPRGIVGFVSEVHVGTKRNAPFTVCTVIAKFCGRLVGVGVGGGGASVGVGVGGTGVAVAVGAAVVAVGVAVAGASEAVAVGLTATVVADEGAGETELLAEALATAVALEVADAAVEAVALAVGEADEVTAVPPAGLSFLSPPPEQAAASASSAQEERARNFFTDQSQADCGATKKGGAEAPPFSRDCAVD